MTRTASRVLILAFVLGVSATARAVELDPRFGSRGMAYTYDMGDGSGGAIGVVVQDDGKVIALAADSSGPVVLVRFTDRGVPDTTFGDGGRSVHFGSPDVYFAGALALQPDGKIVVAGGVSGTQGMFVSRFLPNGEPDPSFGTGGLVVTDFPGLYAGASALALAADGKIVVAGSAGLTGNLDFAAARYDSDGTLDETFGTGGRLVVDAGGGTYVEGARAVVIEDDGRIVLGGVSDVPSGNGFVLLGLLSDGSVDASFGSSGKFEPDLGTWTECHDVVLQRDGKILAVGLVGDFDRPMIALRLLRNGALDPSFGEAGIARLRAPGGAEGAAIDASGRLLLAGSPFILARLTRDGRPDLTLGPEGWLTGLSDGGAQNHVRATSVAVGADGRILLAGSADAVTTENLVVLRYLEAPIPVPTLSEGFALLLVGLLGAAGWAAARRVT
jgi:uncharacterized delta-60 repeat protein